MCPTPSNRNATPGPYALHGFEVSYFTQKVRPALRYKGLWVDERRADIRLILEKTGMAFIPMVTTPEGEVWQDSTDIYAKLEARHPDPPLFPSTPVQRVASHLVELYVDEFGLVPAMHYRWGSELGESSARARFSSMIGNLDAGNHAADRMVKARHAVGASPGAASEIEAHTLDLLDALSAHFETNDFLLGGRASFADCALMGLLDGHFFADLVSRKLMLERAWRVVGWRERCVYPNEDAQTTWLEDDALGPHFVEALSVMGRDAAPVIHAMIRSIEAWADDREGDEMPRGLPPIESELRGAKVSRVVMPYTLYSLQNAQAVYRALDEAERRSVEAELENTGWLDLLNHELRHRLKKDGFKLAFEER